MAEHPDQVPRTTGSGDSIRAVDGELNALRPGYVLHEYRIDEILGSGGFGITYLASDTNLNLRIALKEYLPSDLAVRTDDSSVYPKSNSSSEQYEWGRRRFLDEARALAAFNHPNIVRVLRFFEANNTAYMVMEYVEGEPLSNWIAHHQPLTQDILLAIVAPLLDGIAMIHQGGFLHRDIKPANIHIRPGGSPVLLDFGAARHLSGQTGQELTAIVTPGYAPFEQYHSRGKQGAWSDIYSLCAVLYSIVTGTRPLEAAARVREDSMPKASATADRALYGVELLQAIDWGLQPHEEQRPQTIAQLRRAIFGIERAGELTAQTARHAPGWTPAAPSADADRHSRVTALIDPDTLSLLERSLAQYVGPVAPVIVRRAAKRHTDFNALSSELAEQIAEEEPRAEFLRSIKAHGQAPHSRPTGDPASAISAHSMRVPAAADKSVLQTRFALDMLAAIEADLARHIGPLAKVLVKKSAAKARDKAELYLLLSDHISDEAERKAFVRKSMQAFRAKT